MHQLRCILFVVGCIASNLSADDSFRSEVAAIFENRCLSCHGGDQPKGGFSLQTADAFFDSGHVEPGSSSSSGLIDLITPQGGEAMMPKDAAPLSERELASIAKWIDEGARWPEGFELAEAHVDDFDWWSYQPLQQPMVPTIDDPWAKSPIDCFILEKLRENNLRPSQEADRRTLIRRVTYDLIGLPPTPEEVSRFVNDPDPQAYANLVERLLESKHYGEHWARHWLDVAKYADSCGYDKDKLRPNAWPYRDYVIRSLNDDKPYSQFVREQIAGDVLFRGQPDGIVGLGFLAAGPWDFIGHVEVPESKLDGKVARNLDRDDVVSNVFNTFCSLTVQCARCHNHKFDPITQEHYYGLQAVFAAIDRADRSFDLDPQIAVQRQDLVARRRKLLDERTRLESEQVAAGGQPLLDLNARIDQLRNQLKPVYPPEHGYHSQVEKEANVPKWVELQWDSEIAPKRIVLHACSDDFNGIGDGFGFPVRFKVEGFAGDQASHVLMDASEKEYPNPKLEPITIEVPAAMKLNRIRVTATQLAPRKDDFIFALAELEVYAGDRNIAADAKVQSADSIEAPIRWRRANLIDGHWPRRGEESLLRELEQAEADREAVISEVTTPSMIEDRQRVKQQLAEVESALHALPAEQKVYAATTEFEKQGNFIATGGKPRDVYVLARGEITMPGELATPGVLPLIEDLDWRMNAELSEAERRGRLALWVTDPEHPLTWRSIVNRVWQYHFGEAIAASPNDFGRMGAEPTHPQLLDWLAVEFRDSGQSLKSLHRLIVTSNTYRQTSAHDPVAAQTDGGNRFLWRANRRRLSAEEVRDSILAVSGKMDWSMGGPGYYLFELEKTQHSPHFEYHKFDPRDPASHRRSIYRFIARSQPNPYMTTLDCADSSQSTPRRNETLTSLQALSLMNNQFNLVMAEAFAERLRNGSDQLPVQVRTAFELVTQRSPSDGETQRMIDYATEHGLANLCRMLFNLSEFVFID
ncbi:MAG: PSD1 and planctomycete cytochrome C domain-containing protein [Pirellulaceae bacterium]